MRTVEVRLGVLVGFALLVGTGVVAAAIALATRDRPGGNLAAGVNSTTVVATTSTTAEAIVTSTSMSTSSPLTSTTVTALATSSTTVQRPRGSLEVLGASAGAGLGQGFPSGPCANWRLKFLNNSNTEIVTIVFAPPSGDYSNFREFNRQTQQHAPDIPAEKPSPAVLNVSLPPYREQILAFQTCTTTTPPANTNYEFGAVAPDTVAFTWATGYSGAAPFVR
jgi:hypothetical protein